MVAPLRNTYAGPCRFCRKTVAKYKGVAEKTLAGWRIAHLKCDEANPPPPAAVAEPESEPAEAPAPEPPTPYYLKD